MNRHLSAGVPNVLQLHHRRGLRLPFVTFATESEESYLFGTNWITIVSPEIEVRQVPPRCRAAVWQRLRNDSLCFDFTSRSNEISHTRPSSHSFQGYFEAPDRPVKWNDSRTFAMTNTPEKEKTSCTVVCRPAAAKTGTESPSWVEEPCRVTR